MTYTQPIAVTFFMTNVFLVRHGQASAGTDNYDRLSDVGIEQARLLGEYWKRSGFTADAVFHGTLQRQQHTAELALEGLHIKPQTNVVEGLNEYVHDTVDRLYGGGLSSAAGDNLRFDQYLEIMARWRDAAPTDETQSWQDFSVQGWNAIQNVVAETAEQDASTGQHSNLVFFTSGGIIATVLQQALAFEFEATMHALWQTRNASVTSLLFNRDGVCLVDYNTVPHLQMHAKPELITQI